MAPSDEEVRKIRETAKNMTSEQLQRIAEAGGTKISTPENIERFRASYSDPNQQLLSQFMESDHKSSEKPQTEINDDGKTQFATILLTGERNSNSQLGYLTLMSLMLFFTIILYNIGAWDECLLSLSWAILFIFLIKNFPAQSVGEITRITDFLHCVNCSKNLSTNDLILSKPILLGDIYSHKWNTNNNRVVNSPSPVSLISYPFGGKVGVMVNPSQTNTIYTTIHHSELRQETRMTMTCPICKKSEIYEGYVRVEEKSIKDSNYKSYFPDNLTNIRDNYRGSSPPIRLRAKKKLSEENRYFIERDNNQSKILHSSHPPALTVNSILKSSTIMFESFTNEEIILFECK